MLDEDTRLNLMTETSKDLMTIQDGLEKIEDYIPSN